MSKVKVPKAVWLLKSDIQDGPRSSLAIGTVTCWAWEPSHKPNDFVKYKITKKGLKNALRTTRKTKRVPKTVDESKKRKPKKHGESV